MPVFIRLRWIAFRMVRALRRSILHQDSDWQLEADTRGRPILAGGGFRIMIEPRAVRLFDAIHLYCDDVEIWLPILARLRLRSAVRLFLLRMADDTLAEPEKPAKSSRSRTRRRQESQA